MSITGLLIFLLIGAVAGWLAGIIMKGGGFGLAGDIIIGIIGAIIGGYLFGLLGIGGGGIIIAIVSATTGALVLLFFDQIFQESLKRSDSRPHFIRYRQILMLPQQGFKLAQVPDLSYLW